MNFIAIDFETATFQRTSICETGICVVRNGEIAETKSWLVNIHLPEFKWHCSLQTARKIYSFGCNSLGYLCERLGIPKGTHHRAGDDAEKCARLYLKELEDAGKT